MNQNTWAPTVDTYGDPNAWRLSQDEAQCRQLAMQAAGSSVKKTAEGVGIGGLLGAAAGAAIGAAAHDPGMGAAVGAAAGGFGGGAYEGFSTNAAFKTRFRELPARARSSGDPVIASRAAGDATMRSRCTGPLVGQRGDAACLRQFRS